MRCSRKLLVSLLVAVVGVSIVPAASIVGAQDSFERAGGLPGLDLTVLVATATPSYTSTTTVRR